MLLKSHSLLSTASDSSCYLLLSLTVRDTPWKWRGNVCPLVTHLFHLLQCSLGSFTWSYMAGFVPFKGCIVSHYIHIPLYSSAWTFKLFLYLKCSCEHLGCFYILVHAAVVLVYVWGVVCVYIHKNAVYSLYKRILSISSCRRFKWFACLFLLTQQTFTIYDSSLIYTRQWGRSEQLRAFSEEER